MELHDYPVQKTIVVTDGKRILVKARHIARTGWLLKAYDFNWVHPDASKPNCFGHINRNYLTVGTKRQARDILQTLAS